MINNKKILVWLERLKQSQPELFISETSRNTLISLLEGSGYSPTWEVDCGENISGLTCDS